MECTIYQWYKFAVLGLSKIDNRLPEIRRSRRTCPANFRNVRRRAVVKFNQMSGERLQMSGEAQKVFGKPVINSDYRYKDHIDFHSLIVLWFCLPYSVYLLFPKLLVSRYIRLLLILIWLLSPSHLLGKQGRRKPKNNLRSWILGIPWYHKISYMKYWQNLLSSATPVPTLTDW